VALRSAIPVLVRAGTDDWKVKKKKKKK